MRIKWKGQDLGEFSGQPRVQEARLIKAELGLLPVEFGEAMNNGDPDAVSMMIAMMMTRSGKPTSWKDIEGEFDDFTTELSDAELVDINAELKERGLDPVGKDGKPVSSEAGRTGSSDGEGEDSPSLTWTPRSDATPSDSGSTSA